VWGGLERDNDREATLEIGDVIEALEMGVNQVGQTRIRYGAGWVVMRDAYGKELMEKVPFQNVTRLPGGKRKPVVEERIQWTTMSYRERKEKENEIVADAMQAEQRKTQEISRRIALEQQYEALKEICVVNAAAAEADHASHVETMKQVERDCNKLKTRTFRVLQAMAVRMEAVNTKVERHEHKIGSFQSSMCLRHWRRQVSNGFCCWGEWVAVRLISRECVAKAIRRSAYKRSWSAFEAWADLVPKSQERRSLVTVCYLRIQHLRLIRTFAELARYRMLHARVRSLLWHRQLCRENSVWAAWRKAVHMGNAERVQERLEDGIVALEDGLSRQRSVAAVVKYGGTQLQKRNAIFPLWRAMAYQRCVCRRWCEQMSGRSHQRRMSAALSAMHDHALHVRRLKVVTKRVVVRMSLMRVDIAFEEWSRRKLLCTRVRRAVLRWTKCRICVAFDTMYDHSLKTRRVKALQDALATRIDEMRVSAVFDRWSRRKLVNTRVQRVVLRWKNSRMNRALQMWVESVDAIKAHRTREEAGASITAANAALSKQQMLAATVMCARRLAHRRTVIMRDWRARVYRTRVLTKALRRLNGDSRSLAFMEWREQALIGKRRQQLVTRAVSVMTKRTCLVAFYVWSDRARMKLRAERVITEKIAHLYGGFVLNIASCWVHWVRVQVNQRRQVEKMRDHLQHERMSAAFEAMRDHAVGRRRLKAVAKRVVMKIRHMRVAIGFEMWSRRKLIRTRVQRAVLRWNTFHTRSALQMWLVSIHAVQKAHEDAKREERLHVSITAANAALSKQQMLAATVMCARRLAHRRTVVMRVWRARVYRTRVLTKALHRLNGDGRSLAFMEWREQALIGKRRQQLVTRAVSVMTKRTCLVAFYAWLQWATVKFKKFRLNEKVKARLQRKRLSTAFGAVHSHALDARRLAAIGRRVILRLGGACVAAAFDEWSQHRLQNTRLRRLLLRLRQFHMSGTLQTWRHNMQTLQNVRLHEELQSFEEQLFLFKEKEAIAVRACVESEHSNANLQLELERTETQLLKAVETAKEKAFMAVFVLRGLLRVRKCYGAWVVATTQWRSERREAALFQEQRALSASLKASDEEAKALQLGAKQAQQTRAELSSSLGDAEAALAAKEGDLAELAESLDKAQRVREELTTALQAAEARLMTSLEASEAELISQQQKLASLEAQHSGTVSDLGALTSQHQEAVVSLRSQHDAERARHEATCAENTESALAATSADWQRKLHRTQAELTHRVQTTDAELASSKQKLVRVHEDHARLAAAHTENMEAAVDAVASEWERKLQRLDMELKTTFENTEASVASEWKRKMQRADMEHKSMLETTEAELAGEKRKLARVVLQTNSAASNSEILKSEQRLAINELKKQNDTFRARLASAQAADINTAVAATAFEWQRKLQRVEAEMAESLEATQVELASQKRQLAMVVSQLGDGGADMVLTLVSEHQVAIDSLTRQHDVERKRHAAAHAEDIESASVNASELQRKLQRAHAELSESIRATHTPRAALASEKRKLAAITAQHERDSSLVEGLRCQHEGEIASLKREHDVEHSRRVAAYDENISASLDAARRESQQGHAELTESLRGTEAELASEKRKLAAITAQHERDSTLLEGLRCQHECEIASLKREHDAEQAELTECLHAAEVEMKLATVVAIEVGDGRGSEGLRSWYAGAVAILRKQHDADSSRARALQSENTEALVAATALEWKQKLYDAVTAHDAVVASLKSAHDESRCTLSTGGKALETSKGNFLNYAEADAEANQELSRQEIDALRTQHQHSSRQEKVSFFISTVSAPT
jgi:hypothetical protein